jgi:hypothetical protein
MQANMDATGTTHALQGGMLLELLLLLLLLLLLHTVTKLIIPSPR